MNRRTLAVGVASACLSMLGPGIGLGDAGELGEIRGRVLDWDESPQPGADVTLTDALLSVPGGRAAIHVRADDRGEFRAAAPPGVWTVWAAAPGRGIASAGSVVLGAGARVDVACSVPPSGRTLLGKLVRADGTAAADVRVHLTEFPLESRSDTSGAWELRGVPGQSPVVVEFEHPSGERTRCLWMTGANGESVRLEAARRESIPLADAEGHPAAERGIIVVADDAGIERMFGMTGRTDARGALDVSSLSGGRIRSVWDAQSLARYTPRGRGEPWRAEAERDVEIVLHPHGDRLATASFAGAVVIVRPDSDVHPDAGCWPQRAIDASSGVVHLRLAASSFTASLNAERWTADPVSLGASVPGAVQAEFACDPARVLHLTWTRTTGAVSRASREAPSFAQVRTQGEVGSTGAFPWALRIGIPRSITVPAGHLRLLMLDTSVQTDLPTLVPFTADAVEVRIDVPGFTAGGTLVLTDAEKGKPIERALIDFATEGNAEFFPDLGKLTLADGAWRSEATVVVDGFTDQAVRPSAHGSPRAVALTRSRTLFFPASDAEIVRASIRGLGPPGCLGPWRFGADRLVVYSASPAYAARLEEAVAGARPGGKR